MIRCVEYPYHCISNCSGDGTLQLLLLSTKISSTETPTQRDIQIHQRCLGRFYRMDSDMFDSFQIGTSILYAIYHLIDFGVIGTAGKEQISLWTPHCRWHTCLDWRNFVVSNIPSDPPRVLYKHRLLLNRLVLEMPKATGGCQSQRYSSSYELMDSFSVMLSSIWPIAIHLILDSWCVESSNGREILSRWCTSSLVPRLRSVALYSFSKHLQCKITGDYEPVCFWYQFFTNMTDRQPRLRLGVENVLLVLVLN